MNDKPVVYIIAGPNGSGKTTFAREFLPRLEANFEFVNANYLLAGFRRSLRTGPRSRRKLSLLHIRQLRRAHVFRL